MTTIRKIVTSKIDGNDANTNDTNEIRPFGEISVYLDQSSGTDKLTLMMFEGQRTHLKSKVLMPGVLFGSNADSGDDNGRDTIKLVPDAALYGGENATDQYLIIDPTAGEPGHIHIRAGGEQDQSSADLYLGAEQTFVRVSDTSGIVTIRTTNQGEPDIAMNWSFETDGNLYFPGIGNNRIGESEPGLVVSSDASVVLQSNNTGESSEWYFGADGNLKIPGDIRSEGNINIDINLSDSTLRRWQFGEDGVLRLPSGGDILDANGNSILSQLVGDGFVSGTGVQRTVYTNAAGYGDFTGGETTSFNVDSNDIAGIEEGDQITFRNGEIRTISNLTVGEGTTTVEWTGAVYNNGGWDPRLPAVFTSQNYSPETKKTARIKPDLDTEDSGQYMEVYVGGAEVVDNKHVHMKGHSDDTELFLGSDSNFVSAKDSGSSPARVNLKSENDITVSDTNLRMTRASNWAVVYGDGQNRNFDNAQRDLHWGVIDSDDQGNYYVGGEHAYNDNDAIVAKYGPDGDLIWKKHLDSISQNTLNGRDVHGVAYNSAAKEVAYAVQTNAGKDYNYYKINIFDSETGELKKTDDVFDDQGNLNVRAMIWHPTLGYTLAGNNYGEIGSTAAINSVATTYNLTTAGGDSPQGELFVNSPDVVPQAGDRFTYGASEPYVIDSVNTYSGYYGLVIASNTNFGDPPSGQPVVLRRSKSTVGIIELPINSVLIGGQYPEINGNSFISGTGISGSQNLQAGVGLYRNVPVINLTNPSATGLTVGIRVVYGQSPSYDNFSSGTTGTGYSFGDSFKILGSNLGGVDGVNDITGTIIDNDNISNDGFTGTPAATTYRIDMGYAMGYGSTDFSFGTFTITSSLNYRAFVWTQSWSRFLNPIVSSNTSSARCLAFDGYGGGLVVGGIDNAANLGFVWKLAHNGTTNWVKGIDNDNYDIASIAASEVTGDIYYTTTYNSLNKLDFQGNFIKRVTPQGMWGHDWPQVKIQQELDGDEYLYVGGRHTAIWAQDGGFMLNKLDTGLKHIWSREIVHDAVEIYAGYNYSLNYFTLGKDKATMVGYSRAMSPDYFNGVLLTLSTADDFRSYDNLPWVTHNVGSEVYFTDATDSQDGYNFLTNGASVSTSSLQYDDDTSNHTWTNWAYRSSVINLNNTDNGIVGVETIKFADGGVLDHNPSDIPLSPTDFYRTSWNYTLKLSDRGKFIINQPKPNGMFAEDLYITVPTNNNVSFPVGSVITLINTSSIGSSGHRIYVQPENYGTNNSPRIWVNGSNFDFHSTWSFQGIQAATLMKINSNDWLLTCVDPTDED